MIGYITCVGKLGLVISVVWARHDGLYYLYLRYVVINITGFKTDVHGYLCFGCVPL